MARQGVALNLVYRPRPYVTSRGRAPAGVVGYGNPTYVCSPGIICCRRVTPNHSRWCSSPAKGRRSRRVHRPLGAEGEEGAQRPAEHAQGEGRRTATVARGDRGPCSLPHSLFFSASTRARLATPAEAAPAPWAPRSGPRCRRRCPGRSGRCPARLRGPGRRRRCRRWMDCRGGGWAEVIPGPARRSCQHWDRRLFRRAGHAAP